MTAPLLLESMAKEFAVDVEALRRLLELLDAGYLPPYLARFRRAECGALEEPAIRAIVRRRGELEDLDRRRASIVRLLEAHGGVPDKVFDAVRRTTDRFELEDLFLPFRRPEPEVQKAMERGLTALADLLVAPVPVAERRTAQSEPVSEDVQASSDAPHAEATDAEHEHHAVPEESEVEHALETAPDAGDETEHEEDAERPAPTLEASIQGVDAEGDTGGVDIVVTPELVRLCRDFVRPDHGVHTEEEALAGAMRILSDRLGRHTALRGQVRRILRKQGILSVRAAGGDEQKAGRHKGLLKIRQPLPQIQGHRLLQLRHAQRDRSITTVITLPLERALPKVREALGRHTRPEYEGVLSAVARRALERRLLPMLEADVRLELKERGDAEALRFLGQELRQVLMTAQLGPRPAAGIDVNAKGELVVAVVDEHGALRAAPSVLSVPEGDDLAFAEALAGTLRPHGIQWIAMGASRAARPAVRRVREAVRKLGADATVLLVNEAGLSNYANSELARRELPDLPAPARQATSLARRLQDPMAEFLKIDPRHLGLGFEQGLVSKHNLRRLFQESIESAVAHVGLDATRASAELLALVPGLDAAKAKAIVEFREAGKLTSREALRESGTLDEVTWANAIAFLRVPGSSEPLDATSLHPQEYDVARRILDATGEPREAVLGRFGALRGLSAKDFDVDEPTWRDYQRELGHPGRDPRPRVFAPALLAPDTAPESIGKDTVVEGVVSNVANFGAFVDLGIDREGIVHISELGHRFVRDARETVSIGQVVRARVLDTSGPRIALSFKNMPDRGRRPRRAEGEGEGERERPPRDRKRGGDRGGERRGRRDLGRDDQWPEPQRMVRAASSRRDGMPMNPGLRSTGTGGRPGGPPGGGRGGGGRDGGGRGKGGPGGARGFDRGRRDDFERGGDRPAKPTQAPANTPFASFFKKGEKDA